MNEVTSMMESPDFILEPTIYKTLSVFMRCGGSPENAIELLSHNYRGYPQMITFLLQWLRLCGINEEFMASTLEQCIKDIVTCNFDTVLADSTLVWGNATPEWLEDMIKLPQWRSLLCELSEKHRNCLLLNFAIRKISDAGYQEELATVTSASTYIEVFNRVLVQSLKGILCKKNYDQSETTIANFAKLVCTSSNTYLYAQALLLGLCREERGYVAQYISQEVMQIARKQGRNVDRLHIVLAGVAKHPVVALAILSMLSSKRVLSADVIQLHSQYASPNPPSIDLIRIPELFRLFTEHLFNYNKSNANTSYKSKLVYMLACMASIKKSNDRTDLNSTITSLETAMAICLKNDIRYQSTIELSILVREMRLPVVCSCLIHWIGLNLEEPSYFQLEYATTRCVPIHLALLDQIALRQPLLHAQIFELLVTTFSGETTLEVMLAMDVKRIIIDRMIHLVSRGYVSAILAYWKKTALAQSVQPSLLRYFICEFLRLISPPFDSHIVSCITHISSSSEKALDTEESIALLREFFSECKEDNLSTTNAKLLFEQRERVGLRSPF